MRISDWSSDVCSSDLAVGDWAERRGIPYASYQELATHPEVGALVAGHVAKVNADLARDEQPAGSQVRRFLVLHKALDADDGALTRTRTVRRGIISEKYAPLLAAPPSEPPGGSVTSEERRVGKKRQY